MAKSISKKALGIVLTLSLLINPFYNLFGFSPSVEAAASLTFSTTKTKISEVQTGNLLTKVKPEAKMYWRNNTSSEFSETVLQADAALTDGNVDSNIQIGNSLDSANFKGCTDGSLRYMVLLYDLSSVCDISGIVFSSASAETMPGKYEIYIGAVKSIILDKAPLFTYDYTKSGATNYHSFKATDVRTQYLAVKIIMPYTTKKSDYVNLSEFTIYGKKHTNYSVDVYSEKGDNPDLLKKLGMSVVTSNAHYVRKYYDKTSKTYKENGKPAVQTDFTNLCDSSITEKSESRVLQDGWFFDKNYIDGEGKPTKVYCDGSERVFDLYYDLGMKISFKNIAVSHSTTELLATGLYALYSSNDLSSLYNDENMILTYKNPSSRLQLFTFPDYIAARYVGMRVLNCISTDDLDIIRKGAFSANAKNIYYRGREFNIYGADSGYEKTQSNYPPGNPKEKDSEGTYDLNYSPSLIAGKLPTDKYAMVNGYKKQINCNAKVTGDPKDFHRMTDGKGGWNYDIHTSTWSDGYFVNSKKQLINDPEKLYFQFNYKFDAKSRVTGFMLHGTQYSIYQPFRYLISVADSEKDLFTDNSYISPEFYSGASYVSYKLGESPDGAYVALRVICGVQPGAVDDASVNYTQTYLRIGEFMVFGTYSETVVPSNILNVVHSADGGTYTTSCDAEITYSLQPDSNGAYPKGTKATYRAPVSFRSTRDEKMYFFNYWSSDNEGKNKISDSDTYTLTLSNTSQLLFANYKTTSTHPKVKYTFKDAGGKTIYTADVTYGDYLSADDGIAATKAVPYVTGYVGKTANTQIGAFSGYLQVWDDDAYGTVAISDKTFKAVYTASSTLYDININGQAKHCIFDTKITATDNNALSWDVNGVPFGSGKTFTSYVVGDMDVVSKAQSTDKYISIYNGQDKKSAEISGGNYTFFMKKMLPTGATLTEAGIIVRSADYLTDSDYLSGTYSKLKLTPSDSGNFQQIKANNPSGDFFSVTLTGVPRKSTRIAMAYVKYTKSSQNYTAYSNVAILKAE